MLSRKIHAEMDYRKWHPIKLSRQGPPISHLIFANDITLTSKLTTQSINSIIDILNLFTKASGQTINYTKSKKFFSKNASMEDKDNVLNSFHMREGSNFKKYLGYLTSKKITIKENVKFDSKTELQIYFFIFFR